MNYVKSTLFCAAFAMTLGLPASSLAGDKEACLDASSKAQDFRADGKLVEALAQLLACARPVCPGVVQKDCAQWLAEVEPSIPTVVVSARDAKGADVLSGVLRLDGKALPQGLDGKSVSVNPGPHTIALDSDQGGHAEVKLMVRQGQKNRAIALSLAAVPVVVAPVAVAPTAKLVDNTDVPAQRSDGASGLGAQKVGAIALVAGGVVGVVLGTTFGLSAGSQWSDAKNQCAATSGCLSGSRAYEIRDSAQGAATLSTVSFVVGGLALAGGVVLWLWSPAGDAKVSLAPTPGGALLTGAF